LTAKRGDKWSGIQPYSQEIYSGCGFVLRWQHRDLWSFAGARYVPDTAVKRRLCGELVDYFDGTSHYRHPDRGVQSQPLWFVHPHGAGGGAGERVLIPTGGGRAAARAAVGLCTLESS
jgi:hypothetical protein